MIILLEELKILNGKLLPSFDKYNELYTVFVNSDVDKLEYTYITSGADIKEVTGNENFKTGENLVLIKLDNDTTYELTVIKEEEQKTTSILDTYEKVEVKPEMPSYIPSLIGIICFLLIILSYVLIFSKKNK